MNGIKRRGRVFQHIVLIMLSLAAIFPIYWMVISSIKGQGEIFSVLPYAIRPTLQNYIYAFSNMPILRMMVNSFIISGVETAAQLVIAIFSAYALMRWDFPGKTVILGIFMLTWLVPGQVIMVPNYIQISHWALNGSLLGIILPSVCSIFGVLSLFTSFGSLPRALVDASRLDGSSELQTMKNIVMPNMRPAIFSLGILLFINSWNDYIWPMLMSKNLDNSPIQIGLRSFISSESNTWGSLMAATTFSCIPILLLYLCLQRNIINSFLKSGIK